MHFGLHARDLPTRRMRMKIVILDGYKSDVIALHCPLTEANR